MPASLTWTFPCRRPHAGAPLANGRLGVLVWGAGRELRLTIGLNGFWDRRGGGDLRAGLSYARLRRVLADRDQAAIDAAFGGGDGMWGRGAPHQVGGGRLVVTLPDGWSLAGVHAGVQPGTLRIAGERAGTAHPRRTAAILDLAADRAELRLTLPPPWVDAAWSLIPAGRLAAAAFAEHGYPPPREWNADGRAGFVQELPADDGLWMQAGTAAGAADADGRGQREIVLAAGLGTPPAAPAATARWERAAAGWRAAAVGLPRWRLPDADLAEAIGKAAHRAVGCTMPGGAACTLQGPLMEDDRIPPWCNDYHYNINAQMIYGSLLPLGREAHGAPLWDMLMRLRPGMQAAGRAFFGVDDALMLPHACDDRGQVVGSFWTGTVDHGATAWMALLAFDWWRYGGDDGFLRDFAYPFLRGAIAGYRAMAEPGADGRLHLPLSVSPEFRGKAIDAWGADASFQLAACHAVLRAAARAAAALGEAPDPAWADLAARLPPYATVRGPRFIEWPGPAVERIGIWQGQDLPFSHRHHSHLAGLWPFCTIDAQAPEHAGVVAESLHWWTLIGAGAWSGWCVPWAAAIWARCGNADAWLHWLRHWRSAFVNEGGGTLHDAAFIGGSALAHAAPHRQPMDAPHGEIFQLDAGCGAISALAELAVQERHGELRVLPAGLPRDWRDFEVDDLGCPGGFRLSFAAADGALREVAVTATRAGRLRLRHGLGERWQGDGAAGAGPLIDRMMAAGERLRLRAG